MQADIDVILAREQQQLQQTYFGGGLAPSSPSSVASPPEPALSADVMASSTSQPPPPHATSHHKNGGNPTPVERRRRRKLPLIERPRSAPIHATPETFLQNRVRKKKDYTHNIKIKIISLGVRGIWMPWWLHEEQMLFLKLIGTWPSKVCNCQ